ncbi:CBS domain-containing protein [Bacillus sp. 165]|uniref:CBS domain-containing protein n=1 Tax=Bacillus sp. 165 TaxID=1529117 RepID=UPI001ADC53C6|nr:CBS domain-containing protein [Bacillus sp. 165]MBO9128843.1 CBS domain-containing protein [Bacillus sp. 165]
MATVREIMSTDIFCCTPLDNAYEAALMMKQQDVGVIPVVENGHVVGLVTDRDLVIRGIAEKHPGSSKITDLMSTEVICVSPNDPVEKATELMATHQIRRLPVVENGQLVGMLSLGDIAVEDQVDEQAGIALSEISEDYD